MTVEFPAIMCFSGSIVFFTASIALRRLRAPEKPRASRPKLSLEESRKIFE